VSRILLACMPKSGSTFASDVIASLPKYTKVSLAPALHRREQEICSYTIYRKHFFKRNFVAQHHVRNSKYTQRVIRRHNIKVVVLRRNLFDCVASLRDHIRIESVVVPMAFISGEEAQKSDRDLEIFIARLVMPWYISFHMSWVEQAGVLNVNYENLTTDPTSTIREVLAFLGDCRTDAEINAAIKRVETENKSRKNVGIVGRGKSISHEAREIIRAAVLAYEREPDEFFRDLF